MIVVVTGGCGFVGLNLLRELLSRNLDEIRVVDNLSNSAVDSLVGVLRSAGEVQGGDSGPWSVETSAGRTGVSLTVSDVRDGTVAESACAGADAAIHLAAQTGVLISIEQPQEDVSQNVIGTMNYLEACRRQGVERFIAASSMAVVGDAEPPLSEDLPFRPLSPYAASKAAIEGYIRAYWRSFGLKGLALRFSNVYGPFAWRKGSVVAAFCKRGLSGEALLVDGDGGQSRDFIFSEDLAGVIAEAALGDLSEDNAPFGEAVNVATGTQTPIIKLAEATRACLADNGIQTTLSHGPARDVDVRQSIADTERLRRLFPKMSLRQLDVGLPLTVRWFCDHWQANRAA